MMVRRAEDPDGRRRAWLLHASDRCIRRMSAGDMTPIRFSADTSPSRESDEIASNRIDAYSNARAPSFETSAKPVLC